MNRRNAPDMPANTLSLALLLLVIALLVVQPDFGQTMLIALVWSALFFMAGMRVVWVAGIAGLAGIGLLSAYYTVPHVARRIQRFVDPASGDTFNIDVANRKLHAGRLVRQGTWRGYREAPSPESHTDFVFAVAAEEFGLRFCLALVALFAFIVIRMLIRAMRNDDPFTRFAAAGLTILFATQSAINMAVNLHLIPAKGMTLPFISYGGSSMISIAYAHGHVARVDPRAATRGDDCAGSRGGRERDLMATSGAPLVLLAGRRHRRSFVSGRSAGHRAPRSAASPLISPPTTAPRISNFLHAPCMSSPAPLCADVIRYRWRAPQPCSRSARPKPGQYSAASGREAVVGFGGYPTVPPLLAASWRARCDDPARAEQRHGARQQVSGASRHRYCNRLPRAQESQSPLAEQNNIHRATRCARRLSAAASVPIRRAD